MDLVQLMILLLCSFFLLRNLVTYKICGAAINRASRLCHQAVDSGDTNYMAAFRIYEQRSYVGIMFDLTCWTAEKAYPQLFEDRAYESQHP